MQNHADHPPANLLYERPTIVLAAIVLLTLICFYPLAGYFFAQDDFILLFKSSEGTSRAIAEQFGQAPGQFRPLTKVFYFIATWNLFGLNALPYHIISFIIHIANTLLVYTLLRRLKVGEAAALMVTTVFALHVGFVNVIGWISCIQPLMGEFFALLALNTGIVAIDKRRARNLLVAVACYVLALMSMEQTWAVGIALFLYAWFEARPKKWRPRLKASLGRTLPFVTILFVYVLFMTLWKGVPSGGTYVVTPGPHIVINLLTYLSWVYDISVIMPFATNAVAQAVGVAHVLILLLVVYNLARGKAGLVVIGLAYYVLAILPAAVLKDHTFYNHNYVPAVGMLLLLALPLEDFAAFVRKWRPGVAAIMPLGFAVVIAVVCFTSVRTNQHNMLREAVDLPKNFVFRRALIAGNAYEGIKEKAQNRERTTLYMIFTDDASWYGENVTASLGGAAGPRLFLSQPALQVHYIARGDTIQNYHPAYTEVLFYDHMGRIYTREDVGKRSGRSAIRELGNE